MQRAKSARLVVVLAALALVVAGLAPWPTPRRSVEAALRTGFVEAGGDFLAIDGRTAFALLPYPRLIARDVRMRLGSGLAVSAHDVRLSLDFLALLRGRIVPHALLVGDAVADAPAWASRAPAALLDDFASRRMALFSPFDTVTVRNLAVRVGSDRRGHDDLDSVSGVWNQGSGSGSLRMSARWRGEMVQISFDGPIAPGDPGDVAPVAFTISSRPLTATFAGAVAGGDAPRLRGRLGASTLDGVDLARWLDAPPPAPGRLDSLTVEGALDAGVQDAALSDARVTLNGDVFEGVLGLRLDGARPLLSATLATPTADVTDQLSFLLPRRAPDESWSRERFDVARAAPVDLDLRVSASVLIFNRLAFERTAFSVLLRGPRFEFALSEAHVGAGSLKGRLVLSALGGGGVELKSALTVDQVEIGPALLAAIGVRRLAGSASLSITLDSSGDSSLALAQNAAGKLAFSIRDGALLGIDLDRFLLRLERRSVVAALDVPVGETPFRNGGFSAVIVRGEVRTNEGFFESPSLSIRYAGQSDAPNRVIDLTGSVAQAAAAGQATVVPFTVKGSWSAPRISADMDALRRKS